MTILTAQPAGLSAGGRRALLAACLLALAVLALYGRALTFDFVNYDDNVYVYDNPNVTGGLTWSAVSWAFRDISSGNWHPLAWLSHMLDVELFGLKPWGHHLVNVLLHAANTILLFLLLERMTAACWASAFVAALFAVHPLHVQSVAWVSERKDVLSTFLWLATAAFYLGYLRRRSFLSYLPVALSFAAGLMAKPMLVTLPVTLLLLDGWPLGRWGRPAGPSSGRTRGWAPIGLGGLLAEKVPLLVLAGASSMMAYVAQSRSHSVSNLVKFPLGERLANSLTSLVAYIGKMVLPRRLAVFYPLPNDPQPVWQVLAAAAALAAVTFLVLRAAGRRPFLAVGWFWYLITVAPVIGIIQVGDQSMADRYTYVPLTGLFIMIAWGVADLLRGWARRRAVLGGGAALVLAVLAALAWRELGYWRGSLPLMERAVRVTTGNYAALNNLGSILYEDGRVQEAIACYEEAIRIRPAHANAHYNLGVALLEMKRYEEAAAHFRMALHPKPDDFDARLDLGVAYLYLEKYEEAADQFRESLRLRPDSREARSNLGVALARLGRENEAAAPSAGAMSAEQRAFVHFNTGNVLLQEGNLKGAINHFQTALRLQPGYEPARRALEEALARSGR